MTTRASGEAPYRGLYRAKAGFVTLLRGVHVTVAAGDLVDAKDPILRRRQDLFEPYVPKVRDYKTQERGHGDS